MSKGLIFFSNWGKLQSHIQQLDLNTSIREETYNTSSDATEGRYESYRDTKLPQGYTAYDHKNSIDQVYDKYEYDIEELQNYDRPKPSFWKRFRIFLTDMTWLKSFGKSVPKKFHLFERTLDQTHHVE